MNLENLAYVATIVGTVIAFVAYRHSKKNSEIVVEHLKQKTIEKGIRPKIEEQDKNKSPYLTQSFGVGKVPYFPVNPLAKIIYSLTDQKNNHGNHVWQGFYVNDVFCSDDYVVTTCDCRLAISIWSKRSGSAIKRLIGNLSESYTTVFMVASDNVDHILFGNGKELYYSYKLADPLKVVLPEFELDSVKISRQNEIFFVCTGDKDGYLGLLNFESLPNGSINKIIDTSELRASTSAIKLEVIEDWSDGLSVLMWCSATVYDPKYESSCVVINVEKKQVTKSYATKGIQAVHVENDLKRIAILSTEISVIDQHSNVIYSEALPEKWSKSGEWPMGQISQRPCGNIFAFSVFMDGEIAIRDMSNLENSVVLKTSGLWVRKITWSRSGRYLAFSSYDETTKKDYFSVYDYSKRKLIEKLESNPHYRNPTPFEWTDTEYRDELVILENSKTLKWYTFPYG